MSKELGNLDVAGAPYGQKEEDRLPLHSMLEAVLRPSKAPSYGLPGFCYRSDVGGGMKKLEA